MQTCFALLLYAAAVVAFGVYANNTFQHHGFTDALRAFMLMAPIGWIGGAIFRRLFRPDVVVAAAGFDLWKAQVFWAGGPQIVGIILAALVASQVGAQHGYRGAALVRNKAHQLRISYDFRNVPADRAFKEISRLSTQADPEGIGIRILYTNPPNISPPAVDDQHENISVKLALDFICAWTTPPLRYVFGDDAIHVSAQ